MDFSEIQLNISVNSSLQKCAYKFVACKKNIYLEILSMFIVRKSSKKLKHKTQEQ